MPATSSGDHPSRPLGLARPLLTWAQGQIARARLRSLAARTPDQLLRDIGLVRCDIDGLASGAGTAAWAARIRECAEARACNW